MAHPIVFISHFTIKPGKRSSVAFEFMDPNRWEIYGRPSDASLDTMRRAAASAEVPLTIQPDFLAGFMRLHGG